MWQDAGEGPLGHWTSNAKVKYSWIYFHFKAGFTLMRIECGFLQHPIRISMEPVHTAPGWLRSAFGKVSCVSFDSESGANSGKNLELILTWIEQGCTRLPIVSCSKCESSLSPTLVVLIWLEQGRVKLMSKLWVNLLARYPLAVLTSYGDRKLLKLFFEYGSVWICQFFFFFFYCILCTTPNF